MTIEFHNLIDSTNSRGVFNYISTVISAYLDYIENGQFSKVKETFQLSTSIGEDLDEIATLYKISRGLTETDEQLRTRLLLTIGASIGSSVSAIQDLFEYITSLRPVIVEDFETKIYKSGEIKNSSEEIGAFQTYFNIDIGNVFEVRYINSDGISINLGYTTNVDAGGTFHAYNNLTDPAHNTDIFSSYSSSEKKVYLTGGVLPPLTKIFVTYEIIPSADYDTITELYANKPILNSILNLAKAAGIKTYDIQFVKFLTAFFNNAGYEIITAQDIFKTTGWGFPEFYTGIINNGWDGAFWNSNHWDTAVLVVSQDVIEILTDMAGAVAEDNGTSFTDETTASNESTTNDMTLLPVTPAQNDAYYFAGEDPFHGVKLNITQAGVGTWVATVEYSKGTSTWGTLVGIFDGSNAFRNSGLVKILFDIPNDWATDTVGGISGKYWIRVKLTSYTSITTQPLGAQSWIIMV